jgi:hypothetical protein
MGGTTNGVAHFFWLNKYVQMNIIAALIVILFLSGCTKTVSYIKSCDTYTGVSIHGSSPNELVDNAIPQVTVSCPI